MAQPFVVLSLPRSRSAWLAHYLSAGGEHQIGHNLSLDCASIAEFETKLERVEGTVETGAVLGWRLLRQRLPETKLVTLHRPTIEIVASFARFGMAVDRNELEIRASMLEACSRAPGVDSIWWSDLSDPNCAKWIFELLLGCSWSPEWFASVVGLNIQIDMIATSTQLWLNRERAERLREEVLSETAKLEPAQWMM